MTCCKDQIDTKNTSAENTVLLENLKNLLNFHQTENCTICSNAFNKSSKKGKLLINNHGLVLPTIQPFAAAKIVTESSLI